MLGSVILNSQWRGSDGKSTAVLFYMKGIMENTGKIR